MSPKTLKENSVHADYLIVLFIISIINTTINNYLCIEFPSMLRVISSPALIINQL